VTFDQNIPINAAPGVTEKHIDTVLTETRFKKRSPL
jgi:hypothetical protein